MNQKLQLCLLLLVKVKLKLFSLLCSHIDQHYITKYWLKSNKLQNMADQILLVSRRRLNCILIYILRVSILSNWRRSRDPRVLHEATQKGTWRHLDLSLSFTQTWGFDILVPGDWTQCQWSNALTSVLSMLTLVRLESRRHVLSFRKSQSHFLWKRIQSSSQTKSCHVFPWQAKEQTPSWWFLDLDWLPFLKYLYLQLWHVWLIILYRKISSSGIVWFDTSNFFVFRCKRAPCCNCKYCTYKITHSLFVNRLHQWNIILLSILANWSFKGI